MNLDDFNFGKKITSDEVYIATSINTQKELVNKVKNAFENFKKTSEYKKIIYKYTGNKEILH